jgi:hypothetical protein
MKRAASLGEHSSRGGAWRRPTRREARFVVVAEYVDEAERGGPRPPHDVKTWRKTGATPSVNGGRSLARVFETKNYDRRSLALTLVGAPAWLVQCSFGQIAQCHHPVGSAERASRMTFKIHALMQNADNIAAAGRRSVKSRARRSVARRGGGFRMYCGRNMLVPIISLDDPKRSLGVTSDSLKRLTVSILPR